MNMMAGKKIDGRVRYGVSATFRRDKGNLNHSKDHVGGYFEQQIRNEEDRNDEGVVRGRKCEILLHTAGFGVLFGQQVRFLPSYLD